MGLVSTVFNFSLTKQKEGSKQMSQQQRFINRLVKQVCQPSTNPNEGWIIFYKDDKGVQHYFEKMYSIGRPRFSTSKFALFKDIISCNNMLQKVEESVKMYGVVGMKGKVTMYAAQATIS